MTAARRADLGPAGDFARLLAVERGWHSLVVPAAALDQLRRLCVLVPEGGVVAIFDGPAGTGKTLAAEAVASQLRLDLVSVDARSLADEHGEAAGELLQPIFRAADRPSAVVVLEGADALHPTAASAVARLAAARRPPTVLETRDAGRLDASLTGAARLTVELPAPDEEARRRLWESELAAAEPTAQVALDALAGRPLTGGQIRERVRRGAARARGERRALSSADLRDGRGTAEEPA